MAEIVMIASGKGGTGKSTVSAFLATELALSGKKVLLTELDAGLRSLDVICGTERQTVYDIADVLAGRCRRSKAMVSRPSTDNLKIIAAPYNPADGDFSGFKSFTDKIYNDFDYIIADVSAGLGNPFRSACKAAVTGIVVVTPDLISVRDGRVISDEMYNQGIKDIRLVINKFNNKIFKSSGFADLDRVIDGVCARLIGVVPMSDAIASCTAAGAPLARGTLEKQIFSAISGRLSGRDSQILI